MRPSPFNDGGWLAGRQRGDAYDVQIVDYH